MAAATGASIPEQARAVVETTLAALVKMAEALKAAEYVPDYEEDGAEHGARDEVGRRLGPAAGVRRGPARLAGAARSRMGCGRSAIWRLLGRHSACNRDRGVATTAYAVLLVVGASAAASLNGLTSRSTTLMPSIRLHFARSKVRTVGAMIRGIHTSGQR